MTMKRFALLLSLLALLTAAVSAKDHSGMDRPHLRHRQSFGLSIGGVEVLEATGMEAAALRQSLGEGATIAELIEANEGDVAAVIAAVVTKTTERIQAGAAAQLDELEERISEQLQASHVNRGFWGRRWVRPPRIFGFPGVGDAIMQATGLDAPGMRSALAEGANLAGLITDNDGDVAAVTADIAALITETVNATADERVANLEEHVTDMIHGDFAERWRKGRGWRPPIRLLAIERAYEARFEEEASGD